MATVETAIEQTITPVTHDLGGEAGPMKNPANTNLVRHAGRYLALWEGGLPTEVTPSPTDSTIESAASST